MPRLRLFGLPAVALLLPLIFLIAGCGGSSSASRTSALNINQSSISLDTNTRHTFMANVAGGQPADVNWKVSGGDAYAGAGIIDVAGVYTPSSYLTADSVTVRVTATLKSNPANSAFTTVTVLPSFVQPLSPENASATAGSRFPIVGTISEVNGGSINWVLSTTASGGDGGSSLGTLTQPACSVGLSTYTSCTVYYTAPASLPANPSVYVVARVNGGQSTTSMHILLNSLGINTSPLSNQEQQGALVRLGTSGGNNGDYDSQKDNQGTSYISNCCGGTLGGLVQDGSGTSYILSNNHVLAESDQATIGDSIVQPGLIDGGCVPYGQYHPSVYPVGSLSYYVPLSSAQTNVDAAIAKSDRNIVDATGAILEIGPAQGGALTAAPPAGGSGEPISASSFTSGALRVVKSGRTTGLTCSTIESISQNVNVDYFKDCAETTTYLSKTYTNQISISGNNFSDAGDSGSLILDASNAQPVGLFYAAGSGMSIANPIGDVLSELASVAGESSGSFKVVGGAPHPVSCLDYDANTVATEPSVSPSAASTAAARRAADAGSASLVSSHRGILGTAVGMSADAPGEAAVLVYVDAEKRNVTVPVTIRGVRTVVIGSNATSVANRMAPVAIHVTAGIHLPSSVLAAAIAVKERNWKSLMDDPAIFGVGVAQSRDNPAEAALLVYVDRNRTPRSTPATVGGLRVRYMTIDRFHVTRSKSSAALPRPSSCAIRSVANAQREIAPLRHTLSLP